MAAPVTYRFTMLKFILGGLAVIAVALLYISITRWIPALPFYPARGVTATPAILGLPYEDLSIPTSDGETLSGWFIPASTPEQKFTLLFFHGNGGNISHSLEHIAAFYEMGLAVCVIDYRGFGKSTGSPSVQGTLLDARAVWGWLREEKKLPPERIVIAGFSMGGGVAAALAAEVQPAGLILESTFTSLRDVAKGIYPEPLLALFLTQDYDTPARLKDLNIPLLVAHSPNDEVVPYRLGGKLYEDYTGPKRFLKLSDGHNGGFLSDRNAYLEGVRSFINVLSAQRPQGAVSQ